jgi:hypothetical protein
LILFAFYFLEGKRGMDGWMAANGETENIRRRNGNGYKQ